MVDMSSRTRLFVLVVLSAAATAAFSSSADAQVLERLKAKARQEAVRRAEELLRNANRCVANDAPCVAAAKAAGKEVVLTDTTGKVLTDAEGNPVTDPKQLPPQQPASVSTMTATPSQPATDTSQAPGDGQFRATTTAWDPPDGSARVDRAALDGQARVQSSTRGNTTTYFLVLRSADVWGPTITLNLQTMAPGMYTINRHIGVNDVHYGTRANIALQNAQGSLQILESPAGVLVGTGKLTWPRTTGASAEMVVSFRATVFTDRRTGPAVVAANATATAAVPDVPSSATDGRFVASATNWDNQDGTGRVERTSFGGKALIMPRAGYEISLLSDGGLGAFHLRMLITNLAPGAYEFGPQVRVERIIYGYPQPVALENARGSLRIESAADGILVGSVNVNWARASGPAAGMDASFRARGLPTTPKVREPSGRTASYRPSYPLGLDNLLAAIANLPAARQQEIRRVYDEVINVDGQDPGCLAQAFLVKHGNAPFHNDLLYDLPYHECILRDKVVASMDFAIPGDDSLMAYGPFAAASPAQRTRYRNCLADEMTDVFVETSVTSHNLQYARHAANQSLARSIPVCTKRHLSP
jgi:hypothetical protein